jgi:hypothetical protein
MKNKFILASLFAMAAPAAAQDAMTQLGAAAPAAEELVVPAPDSVPAAKSTFILLDPRTGRTHVVVPAGGGFVYAQTGKFEPAVFTGSGFVLRDGTYMPVVGGAKRAARGGVKAAGPAAMEMWKALNFVSVIEEMDFHAVADGKDVLAADSVSCVDENYTACSMFVTVAGERKLLVTYDASVKLIRAFYSNGFAFDDETGILYASRVRCSKSGEDCACELEP